MIKKLKWFKENEEIPVTAINTGIREKRIDYIEPLGTFPYDLLFDLTYSNSCTRYANWYCYEVFEKEEK